MKNPLILLILPALFLATPLHAQGIFILSDAGRYEMRFDAYRVSGGAYIYRIQTSEYRSVRSMLLLK